MQELFSVPARLLHKSEKLTLDQLALIETLGIGAHAVERSGLREGDEALIVGAGPIGLAVFSFAKLTGAKVRILELQEDRRRFVERLGAATLAEPDKRLADVVFDATGNPQAMEATFEYVAHGGRIVFVGLVQGRLSFDDSNFHRRETTLLSSRNSCGDFPRIIQLIESGDLDTSPWITHRMELSEVPAKFAELRGYRDLVKAVIQVDSA